jgi:phospholipase/carboxylesterase
MPGSTTERRPSRPTEGFTTARLPAHPTRPARLLVPADYQPKYAYPLVVVLHDAGADEEAAARLAPRLSRRNYVAVCPRGSVPLPPAATGRRGYAWADPAADARYVLALIAHAERTYHVHPGRVYLIGVGAGAALAHRLAAAAGASGVAVLNGPPPTRRPAAGVRVFVGHGANNPVVPVAAARRAARAAASAGADVRFRAYPAAGLHDDMLRDLNRWVMDAVSPDPDAAAHFNG